MAWPQQTSRYLDQRVHRLPAIENSITPLWAHDRQYRRTPSILSGLYTPAHHRRSLHWIARSHSAERHFHNVVCQSPDRSLIRTFRHIYRHDFRGVQFTPQLWSDTATLLSIEFYHSTAYHPQVKGMVERFHRHPKSALPARIVGLNRTDNLSWILIGINMAPKVRWTPLLRTAQSTQWFHFYIKLKPGPERPDPATAGQNQNTRSDRYFTTRYSTIKALPRFDPTRLCFRLTRRQSLTVTTTVRGTN